MKRLCLLFLLFAGLAFAAEPNWRSNYEKGLQFIAQGHYEDAVDYLKMAVADKPISEIVAEGPLDYLPYLQLGICYSHLGKDRLAMEFLDLEDALPAVHQSANGRSLLKDFRSKTQPRASSDAATEKAIRNFDRKQYLLKDPEVLELKEEIRQKCKLPKADERSYPWYYHYELGLALKGKDDWQRALDSFISALDNRDRPQKFSRIYGMWFIDYYPYYYVGLAHYHLGNWKCADSSFQLSQMMEDIPKNSEEFRNLVELKADSEKHILDNPK